MNYESFGMGWGMWLIWTIFILILMLVVKGLASSESNSTTRVIETPMEMLKARYARGEITHDEYETMRRDLE